MKTLLFEPVGMIKFVEHSTFDKNIPDNYKTDYISPFAPKPVPQGVVCLKKDIADWCDEFMQERCRLTMDCVDTPNASPHSIIETLRLEFENDNDAVLFALRWM